MTTFLYVLASVALTGGAITALPPIFRFVKAVGQMPGVLERVVYEFSPNHGHSLRDSVDRIESTLTDHTQQDAEKFEHIYIALKELADLRAVLSPGGDPTLGSVQDTKET